ncbi:MAG TPA: hypothetical protein DCE23_05200 [Firmicutes bacterium]|nr:hypothetical protein [Bacillota bacterium]
MSKKYDVKLSIKAEKDLQNIIIYIKDKLKEPAIAERYARIMKKEIESLEYNPQRYAIIDSQKIKDLRVRKLIIKNYIAFYRVNEEKNIVNVDRILYGASNWMYKL